MQNILNVANITENCFYIIIKKEKFTYDIMATQSGSVMVCTLRGLAKFAKLLS